MFRPTTIIVVSDTHLSSLSQGELDQARRALLEFLRSVETELAGPTLFVINGDMLDFLILEKECEFRPFDPAAAAVRARQIIERHAEIFRAIAHLARRPQCRIVILGGNHDPELMLPGVQDEIETSLGNEHQIPPIRWLVHGEPLHATVGCANILVEHGDRYDDWNRVDHAKLREALNLWLHGFKSSGGYEAPPGSQLVIEHVARYRRDYPWMEYLKPEHDTVVPIWLSFVGSSEWRRSVAAVATLLDGLQCSIYQRAQDRLHPSRRFRGGTEVTDTRRQHDDSELDWRAAVREADRRRRALRRWLYHAAAPLARGEKHDARRPSLVRWLKSVARTDRFFDPHAPDAHVADARRMIRNGIDLVVHGHTHAAKAYRLATGLYVNTGTWYGLMRLDIALSTTAEWNAYLDKLENWRLAPPSDGVAHRPTFVHITTPDRTNTVVALRTWDTSKSEPLSTFRKLAGEPCWKRET